MNNEIIITNENISILNKKFKTDLTTSKMKEHQILTKLNRTINTSKYINYIDNKIKLNYESSKSIFYKELNIFNCHIGQLKLFYTLFEFLLILHKKKILDKTLILYIGSAHGFNIYVNNIFFPNVSYLLYDPRKFDKRLYDLPNITIKNNEQGFFGLDKIQEVKDHLQKINKKYIAFISDIRINLDELSIMQDNLLNYKTILELKPVAFMLKLRLPYYFTDLDLCQKHNNYNCKTLEEYYRKLNDLNLSKKNIENIKGNVLEFKIDNYNYIDGKIYVQIFAPPHSGETRLINFSKDGKYKMKYYNIKIFESNVYTFNLTRLFFKYNIKEIENIVKLIMHKNNFLHKFKFNTTYENICELLFIIEYLSIYKKDIQYNNLSDNEKYTHIINIYSKIYKLIPSVLIKRINCISSNKKN
jgi:hypothetical protein